MSIMLCHCLNYIDEYRVILSFIAPRNATKCFDTNCIASYCTISDGTQSEATYIVVFSSIFHLIPPPSNSEMAPYIETLARDIETTSFQSKFETPPRLEILQLNKNIKNHKNERERNPLEWKECLRIDKWRFRRASSPKASQEI